jgi:CheY-like chemotaxis protein
MAITQRLVRLMNGEINLDSEPGRGSLFIVALPQAVVDNEILGEELAENLRSFRMNLVSKRVQINRDPMPYGKVLVVDDVETNIYVAFGLLKLYGLQTDKAMSGYEAIEKISAGQVYDIVFMDHMMPGMDGIETTKRLRELGYNEPVVALTANAVAKQADVFLQNGFDDFIAKPIDIRQLNTVLNHLVRDKQPPEVIEEARKQKTAQPEAEADLEPMLIASFLRDARKALAVLSDAETDMERFTITAHGMKSALANIGEPGLSAKAKELEFAGKAGDTEKIQENTPAFLTELEALLVKYTQQSGAEANENVPLLREKLLALVEICEDYDRKSAAEVIAELNRGGCSQRTRDALDKIMEAVLHSEFEEAGELATQYANSLPVSLAESVVQGLDIQQGLAKYEGDEDTYLKILRSYTVSLVRLLAVPPESIGDYEIAVHGIKGASRDIYAEEVGRQAAALENAAKNGDTAFITENHPALEELARKLADDINALLERIETGSPKPAKDKPDEAILKRLRDAAEVYDMDGAEKAMAEIEAYRYEDDDGLVAWLRERVDSVDFMAIAEKI